MAKSPAPSNMNRSANPSQYVSLPYPLGPTVICGGTNFSLFSAHATKVTLVLFDDMDNALTTRVIPFNSTLNKTSHYWHIFVPGVEPGQIYGYRVDGPQDPQNGLRFDPEKILLDPYAKSIHAGPDYSRAKASQPGDNAATSMKSVVVNLDTFE